MEGRNGEILDLAVATDLRRIRTRELLDAISERAEHLPPRDRALMEQVFLHGKTVSEVARSRGEEPRTLSRHVKCITRRVLDPRFRYVTEQQAAWRPTRQRVAHAYIVEGLSIREAAAKLKLSTYAIRKHREAIDAMFESAE